MIEAGNQRAAPGDEEEGVPLHPLHEYGRTPRGVVVVRVVDGLTPLQASALVALAVFCGAMLVYRAGGECSELQPYIVGLSFIVGLVTGKAYTAIDRADR